MVTLFPIVERELRVASRRRWTYWSRSGAALVALGAFVWVWLMIHRQTSIAERGLMLFAFISGAAFIFTLVAGAAITADTISEEKREGTLGLLFLTDLRGYDVVFGKLFASSLDSFYRLVALFPVLALPVMLGGVAFDEVGRVVLTLANTLFFSLCIGIFFSSVCRDDRRARGATIGCMLFLTVGVPAIVASYCAYNDITPRSEWFILSPAHGMISAFAANHRYPWQFWTGQAIFHGLAWIGLLLACFIVPRTWQDKSRSARGEKVAEKSSEWSHGNRPERKRFRDRLLDVNAVFWLAARQRLKPAFVWAFLGLAFCLWLWLYLKFPNDMDDPELYIMIAGILNTIFKFWIASEAPRLFARDKKSGALELLLSTPISIKAIIQGQFLALWRQFGWQLTLVFILEVGLAMVASFDRDFSSEVTLIWFAGLVMFVADIAAICWLGMWLGLKSKNQNAASGGTLSRVLIVHWFLFFSFITFIEVTDLSRDLDLETEGITGIWLLMGLLLNFWWIKSSRDGLYSKFREIATQRFQPPKAGWFSWLRKSPAEA